MNETAKVGAFTVGGLMALGAATMSLSNIDFGDDDNYTLYAGFRQVIGLEPQAMVRLAGVPIGKVTDIKNDGGGVTVTMSINKGVEIPKNSTVMVASSGVMGDKFVNISPANNNSFMENGEYMYGVDEQGMDTMFENLNKVVDKVDTLLVHMNNIVGDPTVQKSLVDMSQNMKSASEHIDGLTETFERMALNNEGNVNDMANQLNQTLAGMNRTMATVEHMANNIDAFAGDPQTAQDLKETLSNISATSKNIAHMAENMDGVIGDKKTAEDMKETIHNAKSISERADKILTKVDGAVTKLSKTKVTPSADILYSGGADDWNANFNIDISNEDLKFDVGVEDIGDSNKLDLTVGKQLLSESKKSGKNKFSLGARAGIINGDVGLGLDTYIGSRVKLSAEAYDLNSATFRLKSQYKLADSTYILGEWHDFTDSDDRAAYIGIKREF